MPSETLHFEGASGHQLSAHLELPDGAEPIAYAVVAHCFTCSKDLSGLHHIATALQNQGLAVLRFDFTGLGQSEGDFEDTTFSGDVAEVVAAANYLAAHYEAPKLLVGHSLGAAAAIHAAAKLDSVQALATIAAPSSPDAVLRHMEAELDEIKTKGRAVVSLAQRPFTITSDFVDDLQAQSMNQAVANLDRPLLILHSPADQVTSLDHATALFRAATSQRSFVSLDGMDHLLSNADDARYVGRLIAAWASRYL